MKWAASAEIMRSAWAKVRRFGVWPVMRCLFGGSISAGASGCRARIRLNNVSSVGEAVGWVTGSLRRRHLVRFTTWFGSLRLHDLDYTRAVITWVVNPDFATRFLADSQSTQPLRAVLPDSIVRSIAPAR